EDPENQFLPFPGLISYLREPSGPGLRLDSGVYNGWNVPLEYDPLLAKLAAWGPARDRAIERLDRALAEYTVGGIRTNTEFFREIRADTKFKEGGRSPGSLDDFYKPRKPKAPNEIEEAAAALVAAHASRATAAPPTRPSASRWVLEGRDENFR